jgi:hypothetical protein
MKSNVILVATKMQETQGGRNSGEPDARRQSEVEEQGQANTEEGQG